jgi:hypothetical protein
MIRAVAISFVGSILTVMALNAQTPSSKTSTSASKAENIAKFVGCLHTGVAPGSYVLANVTAKEPQKTTQPNPGLGGGGAAIDLKHYYLIGIPDAMNPSQYNFRKVEVVGTQTSDHTIQVKSLISTSESCM